MSVADPAKLKKVEAMDFSKFGDVAEKLGKVYEVGGKVKDAWEAAKTLHEGITEENDSAQCLILMEAFLSGVKLVADGVPLLDKFLDIYADALHSVAQQLVKLFAAIKAGDENGGQVLHPGSWPGGFPLWGLMKKVCNAEVVNTAEVNSEVQSWLSSKKEVLQKITGENPVPSSWVLWTDHAAVKSFVCRKRCIIKILAYGTNSLGSVDDQALIKCNPSGEDEMCVDAPNDCFAT